MSAGMKKKAKRPTRRVCRASRWIFQPAPKKSA